MFVIQLNHAAEPLYLSNATSKGTTTFSDDPKTARKFSAPGDAFALMESWPEIVHAIANPRVVTFHHRGEDNACKPIA